MSRNEKDTNRLAMLFDESVQNRARRKLLEAKYQSIFSSFSLHEQLVAITVSTFQSSLRRLSAIQVP
jgi:hypothetical protein